MPIVVDLGLTLGGEMDRLLAGGGTVGDEVQEVLRLVSDAINVEDGRRMLVPVVVTYSKRRTKPTRTIQVSRWSRGV
jgi:hypothetical protein